MSVKICIIGTGYVGLVTGACFAELGHDVICVDKDERKIQMLLQGQIPIYEPGLEELVARNVQAGRLRFSMDVASSVKEREAIFIAVGTPTMVDSDRADLKYVFAAAKEIAQNMSGFAVIVTKSTVPVGTNRRVLQIAQENVQAGVEVAVASNPEFLREGAAILDFMKPDRIVVGADDARGISTLHKIYHTLEKENAPFVLTGIETAELIKYAANAFLAVKVSFVNEIADLCEEVNANINEVAAGIGLDKRIGHGFLRTGPGWGGSCFPKDTRALHATAQEANVPLRIVEAAILSNASRKRAMSKRILNACGGNVNGKIIGVLGLTFKGQTDDMRESPTLHILPNLIEKGAIVKAYDPSHPREAAHLLPEVALQKSALEAATGADVLVVLTDWNEFNSLDLKVLASAMKRPSLVDLRNLYTPAQAKEAGFVSSYMLGNTKMQMRRRMGDAV